MYDLAIDFRTRDLIVASNKDMSGRSGTDILFQRIHIRLMVARESWRLTQETREFGSRISTLLRVGQGTALASIEAAVLDALTDMTDISVNKVVASVSPTDSRKIQVDITFRPVPSTGIIRTRDDIVMSFLLPPTTL
jgi:hypothetical protein